MTLNLKLWIYWKTLLKVVIVLYEEEIRKVKEKKEYARRKFISRSGPGWRHGQYTYVISAISAILYDTNNFLESHKEILNDFCSEIYRRNSSVILSNHPAYHELHEETSDYRLIKQRTEIWLDLRKQVLITGSTLYASTGLDGLKKKIVLMCIVYGWISFCCKLWFFFVEFQFSFEFTKVYILNVLEKTISLIKDRYELELQRQKESEAMVFLCCDPHRNWSKDQMRWSPLHGFQKVIALQQKYSTIL